MQNNQVRVLTILAAVLLALVALITLVEAPDEEASDPDAEQWVELAPDLEAAGVARMDLDLGEIRVVLAQDEGGWRLVEPEEGAADQTAAEDIVDALLRVELSEPMEGIDLDQAGLGSGARKVVLTPSKGEAVSLTIGADTKVGYRTYVRDGAGVIRTTRSRLGDTLSLDLAELRDRTALTLSPTQAVALTLALGDESLRLERVEDQWFVAGEPRVRADREKVLALLVDLSQLEAAGFPEGPVDTSGGLQLTIDTDTGPLLLALGANEAEASLVPAQVPAQPAPVLLHADAIEVKSLVARDWWSPRLVDLEPGELQHLRLRLGDQELDTERGANGWEPEAGERLATALTQVRLDREGELPEPTGEAWGHLEVEGRSGQSTEVQLFQEVPGGRLGRDSGTTFLLPATELGRLSDAL